MTTKYQPNAANQYEQIVTGTEIVEPQFDPLGNLLQDDRNTYIWDGDIHLLSVSTMSKERPGTKNQEQRTEFRYDPLHRRVARLENQSELTLFTHDGWNVLQEHSGNVKLETSNLKRSARHTWGEDLSGTLQGAGGVGGLLGTIHNVSKTQTQEQEIASWFHYDSNGNVILLSDVAGDASARYAYEAFGQTLTATGIAADLNSYRFSTKPIESGSGLAYYGYRYYDPGSGRWTSEDPIGIYGLVVSCLNANFWAYPRKTKGVISGENPYQGISASMVGDTDFLGLIGLGLGVEALEAWFDPPSNPVAEESNLKDCLDGCNDELEEDDIWNGIAFGADLFESAGLLVFGKPEVGVIDAVASTCIWLKKNSNARSAHHLCREACYKAFGNSDATPIP